MDITVIIPFYNESKSITKTLDLLADQTKKPNQILMIDSGSNDDTVEKIRTWVKKNNLNDQVKILFSDKLNPSSSINKGIECSKTPLVAYIDCGLVIPSTWLEQQYSLLLSTNCDIVSLCVYTEGTTSIDKSFVAQTYGYKNKTPCLPGSIIKREVFDKVGLFLEDSRAGYDVDFINRAKENSFLRYINYDIEVKYFGINYSDNFLNGAKKVFSYSLAGWQTEGDKKPAIYISLLIVFIILLQYGYSSFLFVLYPLFRVFLIPALKSKKLDILMKPNLFIYLLLSGTIIDLSRTLAYIYSLPKLLQRI